MVKKSSSIPLIDQIIAMADADPRPYSTICAAAGLNASYLSTLKSSHGRAGIGNIASLVEAMGSRLTIVSPSDDPGAEP